MRLRRCRREAWRRRWWDGCGCTFEREGERLTFAQHVVQVEHLVDRRTSLDLEREIVRIASTEPFAAPVARISCLRVSSPPGVRAGATAAPHPSAPRGHRREPQARLPPLSTGRPCRAPETAQAPRLGAPDRSAATHADRAVVDGLRLGCPRRGTRFRAFVVADDFTRECLGIEVDTSITGLHAARVLEHIAETRPLPKTLVCDNGPEFTGRELPTPWALRRGVHIHLIRPRKPVENAYAERFKGKFRDECLNKSWFVTLADARLRIEDWRLAYNQARAHSRLGNLTPLEFALRHSSGAVDAA